MEEKIMTNQQKKLEKVKGSCKTAKIVSKIIAIFLMACSMLCVVGAVVCGMCANDINKFMIEHEENVSISDIQSSSGVLNYSLNLTNLADKGEYAQALVVMCVFATVVVLLSAAIFMSISKIFSTIEKSESPFSLEVLKRLKVTFVMLTVLTLAFTGIGSAALLGLILWCIYCILDYGAALQVEIDETL